MVAPSTIWVEPPVTKEEALNPPAPSGGWQPDGYDGGAELPDDLDIDRMLYPHDEGPVEKEGRERREKRDAEAESFRKQRFQESREFEIKAENVTGEDPGPPSMFEEEEKE